MRLDGYRARQSLVGLSALCKFLHPVIHGVNNIQHNVIQTQIHALLRTFSVELIFGQTWILFNLSYIIASINARNTTQKSTLALSINCTSTRILITQRNHTSSDHLETHPKIRLYKSLGRFHTVTTAAAQGSLCTYAYV